MTYAIPFKLKRALNAATYKRVGELFAFAIALKIPDRGFIDLAADVAEIEILMDLEDEKINHHLHYEQAKRYVGDFAKRYAKELIAIKNGTRLQSSSEQQQ